MLENGEHYLTLMPPPAQPALTREAAGPALLQMRPIALVDPKPLRRRFAAGFFERAFPGRLVEASSGAELTGHGMREPALILVHVGGDTLLADSPGRAVLEEVAQSCAAQPIAVVSDLEARPEALAAIAMGARGYIPTTLDVSLVVASLALVEAGGLYAPMQLFLENEAHGQGAPPADVEADADLRLAALDLSPRQQEVLRLLSHGQPNKEIAYRLCMTESTVKVHVRNIMRKLAVTNRTQAAYLANKLIALAAPTRR